jgi:hypothetical protein
VGGLACLLVHAMCRASESRCLSVGCCTACPADLLAWHACTRSSARCSCMSNDMHMKSSHVGLPPWCAAGHVLVATIKFTRGLWSDARVTTASYVQDMPRVHHALLLMLSMRVAFLPRSNTSRFIC